MTRPTYLSLFSGIGGLDLGLDRAGWQCAGQVEIDPYCREVLARHWPEVPRHDDVRTTPEWWLARGNASVDMVCGGFPCQPFSNAGLRAGVVDSRWGWPWMREVIAVVRPRYVIVENVAALLRNAQAMSIVLGDLSCLGFDAEWEVVSACTVGASHTRERVFVVAYPTGTNEPGEGPFSRTEGRLRTEHRGSGGTEGGGSGRWIPEPEVDRVAHGIPRRLVRHPLGALGNAVVPAVAEFVGARLLGLMTRIAVGGGANGGLRLPS